MKTIKLKDILIEKSVSKSSPEYDTYFKAALKKFNIKSPSELNDIKKKEFFDYIDKGWDAGENETDLDETSSVGGMAGGDSYQTPFAFSRRELTPRKKLAIEKNGVKVVKEDVAPVVPEISPKRHIANCVKEIRHQLVEVEKMIDQSKVFKETSGLKSSDFYKRTNNNLKRIGEQIYRIINKMQTIK